jgi:hypothetical protein
MAQVIRKRWAHDGAGRLGYRVAVSADGPRLFLYAATEGAAREVDRVVREALAQHQSHAELALDRWHPLAQEWADASVPLPESDDARAAEHQRLMESETEQSRATGRAAWQVRIELQSHREAVQLAGRLQAEGRPVIRRWKYLILGADNEDEAGALAEMFTQAAPPHSSVRVSVNPAAHVDTRQAVTGEVASLFFDL